MYEDFHSHFYTAYVLFISCYVRGRTREAPEQDCGSSEVFARQLLFTSGLLRNGLQAATALGLRALSSSGQITGECNVVDLLEVLLDITFGVFQQVCLSLGGHRHSQMS